MTALANRMRGEARARIVGRGLTEADVQRIRALPGTLKCIGDEYGISAVMVHFIKTRQKWAHVPEVVDNDLSATLMLLDRNDVFALSDEAFARLHKLCVARADVDGYREVTRRRAVMSIPATLASLEVGQSHMFPTLTATNRLGTRDKAYARRRMGAPDAKWSARLTNKGVRVTRIA